MSKNPDSKKFLEFLSHLYGQTPELWTNRGNQLKTCPNMPRCPHDYGGRKNGSRDDFRFLVYSLNLTRGLSPPVSAALIHCATESV